jgi:predicted transcriptional regulator
MTQAAAIAPPLGIRDGAARPSRFELISDSAMEMMPKPAFLLGDKLLVGGLSVLVGPPGCGKTFMALSWTCSVATGVPLGDDEVRKYGPAVYVAAEGSAGLGARLRSWKTANHLTGALGVHFITEPVSLLSASDTTDFLRALDVLENPPLVIVFDTLARCMVGGDENSTQDMSAFIAGADRIRRDTGAHVMLLHHMNAGGERERGNTALRGACDTMMFLKAEGSDLTLSCEKQKDAAPFPKLHARLSTFGDSCAVLTAKSALQLTADGLTEKQLETLALLQTHFLENGATAKEWMAASNVSDRTFYNYRTVLVKGGYVAAPSKDRGGRYVLTDLGTRTLTANCK